MVTSPSSLESCSSLRIAIWMWRGMILKEEGLRGRGCRSGGAIERLRLDLTAGWQRGRGCVRRLGCWQGDADSGAQARSASSCCRTRRCQRAPAPRPRGTPARRPGQAAISNHAVHSARSSPEQLLPEHLCACGGSGTSCSMRLADSVAHPNPRLEPLPYRVTRSAISASMCCGSCAATELSRPR